MRSEGSRSWFSYLKVLLGAVAVGLLVWILIVGSPESGDLRSDAETTSRPSVDEAEIEGSDVNMKQVNNNQHQELDINNSMRKVRVRKGPDPIHNRRIGVKGGPPRGA